MALSTQTKALFSILAIAASLLTLMWQFDIGFFRSDASMLIRRGK